MGLDLDHPLKTNYHEVGPLSQESMASQPGPDALELCKNHRVNHKQQSKSMVLQITEFTILPTHNSAMPPFKTQYLGICSDTHEI